MAEMTVTERGWLSTRRAKSWLRKNPTAHGRVLDAMKAGELTIDTDDRGRADLNDSDTPTVLGPDYNIVLAKMQHAGELVAFWGSPYVPGQLHEYTRGRVDPMFGVLTYRRAM